MLKLLFPLGVGIAYAVCTDDFALIFPYPKHTPKLKNWEYMINSKGWVEVGVKKLKRVMVGMLFLPNDIVSLLLLDVNGLDNTCCFLL